MACCIHNKGICGDKCCDGTILPETDCGHKFIELPTIISPTVENSVAHPPKWLYVWTDLNTNTPHLSNTFPPWYRNPLYPENYPRVLVYDEYNRLIDDTGTKIDKQQEYKFRQKAIANVIKQEQYKKITEAKVEEKTKQKRLKYLQSKWSKTGIISKEMKQLLAEQVAKKQVTIAMTEEQVVQAWGKPKSYIEEISDGKKKLRYNQGQIILVDKLVKSVKID